MPFEEADHSEQDIIDDIVKIFRNDKMDPEKREEKLGALWDLLEDMHGDVPSNIISPDGVEIKRTWTDAGLVRKIFKLFYSLPLDATERERHHRRIRFYWLKLEAVRGHEIPEIKLFPDLVRRWQFFPQSSRD